MKRVVRVNVDELVFLPRENIIYTSNGEEYKTKFINLLLNTERKEVVLVVDSDQIIDFF